jgi:hypothetical protein
MSYWCVASSRSKRLRVALTPTLLATELMGSVAAINCCLMVSRCISF